MGTLNLPAIRALRPAWNKGYIVGQKLPLKPKHVCAIGLRLELAENQRDLALFNMAIASKLRGRDLVWMQVVNGGVMTCHWGGAKVGQLAARLGA
jgi:hypothetical protein